VDCETAGGGVWPGLKAGGVGRCAVLSPVVSAA